MKSSCFIYGIAAVLSACGSNHKAATENAEAKAQPASVASITVDGQMQDWQGVPLLATANGIDYALANSRDNLYVLFKIADPAEQMKLIRGGMEVWFDPTGKHAKTTEIIYPVKGELPDETFRPNFAQGEKPDTKDLHRRIESGLISFNRIGFKPAYSGVQSIRENTGFKGAINWNESGELIYEVTVPFAAFPTDVKNQNMEVGFFIGAVDKPKAATNEGAAPSEEGGRPMGGGMRGGGGRRGGGAYGGGSRQRGENGQQRSSTSNSLALKKMYEPEAFWVQYTSK
ncbi:hypothetical protein [Flavisolibacter ginsenosidimutans]|uniref:Uncharacterized protein n=1 Tax=Flavisolibacter ginsenosidimutans TaxID=661481 RepID=A0A5B8UFM0_9BACT|nr:hypothetical protein [Flavisolibacter ginsenosidimutans]QEC55467.1 hypothetical protein FSB75_05965 [Flavisolibacter ginsenosidimutans]